jgi:hypothetical protein
LSFSIDQILQLNFSSISINSDVFEVDDEEVIYHDPKEDYRNPKYDCQDQKEDYRNIKYDRYDVKNDLKINCHSPNINQKNEEKKQQIDSQSEERDEDVIEVSPGLKSFISIKRKQLSSVKHKLNFITDCKT